MELRRYEKTSRRLLAAIDKSVTWLTDETHCGEAIDVLVNATHARPQDTEASYNLLCQIQYFKSSKKNLMRQFAKPDRRGARSRQKQCFTHGRSPGHA
jgi:hypothetical protein